MNVNMNIDWQWPKITKQKKCLFGRLGSSLGPAKRFFTFLPLLSGNRNILFVLEQKLTLKHFCSILQKRYWDGLHVVGLL